MLSKYVIPGIRVEIQTRERIRFSGEQKEKKIYHTQVMEVLSEDRLELLMPIEKSKLVLLSVNVEYDLCFYTTAGPFQCTALVIDRYKSEKHYLLLMELTSSLRKVQRREHYRLSCALDVDVRALEAEEAESMENGEKQMALGLPTQRCVMVDISGGGLRFVGNSVYEPGSLVYCKYHLMTKGENKEHMLAAKVLMVKELEGKPGTYEHRVQYIDIDAAEREEIIRFIFEEERKYRKKEKGL